MYHFINDNFHTDIATVPPSYKMKHFHEHNRWELMFIYSGSKSCSISTPNLDFGKSLICPIEATTFVLPPRNFFIVFAFAGDSTITNLSAILFTQK